MQAYWLNSKNLSGSAYMLSRAGCTVECADLDNYATDDHELEFHKLVRDKIPEAILAKGESVVVMRLTGEALIAALRRKLVEESLEVMDARTAEDVADELADVREVALSLMSRLGIAEADVESRRKSKAKARGAFDDALMLSKTAVAPSMGFRQLDIKYGDKLLLISSTIDQEAAIPAAIEELHVDRRLDAAGIAERQFTVSVPAHVAGYRPMRAQFGLPTANGGNHDMIFELLIGRQGGNLRIRARVLNTAVQLELDLDDATS
jgi:predicted house-cleaning noncanonical NTP pyrophosphatase (MazG superfamily)